MPTPLSDFWDFVIGNTEDQNALGAWKYLEPISKLPTAFDPV